MDPINSLSSQKKHRPTDNLHPSDYTDTHTHTRTHTSQTHTHTTHTPLPWCDSTLLALYWPTLHQPGPALSRSLSSRGERRPPRCIRRRPLLERTHSAAADTATAKNRATERDRGMRMAAVSTGPDARGQTKWRRPAPHRCDSYFTSGSFRCGPQLSCI